MTARLLCALGLALTLGASARAADAERPVSFRRDVAPILVRKCLGCHNAAKSANGLNMATFALLRKGGKGAGEAILEPGDPDASELVASTRADASPRMPYKLPALSDGEINTLEAWVREGAKFDGPSEAETPIASLYDPLAGLPKVALKAKVAPPATAAAFSPDGSRIAVAFGREVRLFDARTAKVTATLADHPGPLSALRFSGDGGTLIGAGGRPGMFGAVIVWDVPSSRKVREFRGHNDAILGADLAPDGKTLATVGYDRAVILWDLETGQVRRTLVDHTDAVYAAAFSPDGRRLATAGADRTVKVWNPADGSKLHTLSDATGELYAVSFGKDGGTVLAGGVDRSIRVWDVSGKEAALVGSVYAPLAPSLRLSVGRDGKTLVSSAEDRGVKVWELPSLKPVSTLGRQTDWPQAAALSPDGRRLAVGRHDGSVDLFDLGTGKVEAALQTVKAEAPASSPMPELVRNATLNPPSPRGAAAGSTARLTLTGNGVGLATQVLVDDPALEARIVSKEKPDRGRLDVDLVIAPTARVGLHRLSVVTPLGIPASQTFAVESALAVAEKEPNDDPARATQAAQPATLTGAIDKPGDLDQFRVDGKAGQPLVVRLSAKELGSNLLAVVSILDEKGRVLAEESVPEGTRDPILTATPNHDGPLTIRIADADFGGGGGHFYRIALATAPLLTDLVPLGLTPGKPATLSLAGVNLAGPTAINLTIPEATAPGSVVSVPTDVKLFHGAERRKAVAAEGPQGIEVEPNDAPKKAAETAVPGGVSGRVERPGDEDLVRFQARKGERLILEIFGRRLGSPIDTVLEVLDATGRPVPRAVLRPVTETEVAFRDHNANGPGVRLTRWNNLAMNDTVLFGREVARIFTLPRNPDDDCQFWSEQGQRLGFLETTPEHHPMGQPIYKVEVHPPGATFPAGGAAPTTIYHRNDDGGPAFGKDSRVTFDPPVDGTYLARVGDVRGLGGPDYSYHLVVRKPRPGFTLSAGVENPNIHRGGTLLIPVTIARNDGFEDAVEVEAADLPSGITSTGTVIERGAFTALLALSASATAPAYSAPGWTLRARVLGSDSASPDRQTLDPGGPDGGRITVIPGPNLTVTPEQDRLTIRPGQQVNLRLKVDRNPAFKGRVPIEVRNLPYGVRVLNIGLNGVLVTESQTERVITLYCEPWVQPLSRPFYAVGKAESAGTEHPSTPITLVVEPAATTAAVSASRP